MSISVVIVKIVAMPMITHAHNGAFGSSGSGGCGGASGRGWMEKVKVALHSDGAGFTDWTRQKYILPHSNFAFFAV